MPLEDQLHARGINLHILTGICVGIHRPDGATIADKILTGGVSVLAGVRGGTQISHRIVISAGARLYHRPVSAAVGQYLPELAAGGDVELGEDLGQVVLDGTRAEE